MKILKIENGEGYYYSIKQNAYFAINNIDKDALLELVKYVINNDDFEIDLYEQDCVKNNVQQIVYKDIYEKINQLKKEKTTILNEIEEEFSKSKKKYIDY